MIMVSCDFDWYPEDWSPVNDVLPCLQILHGRPRKDANSSMFPGSPSTTEVHIVIPSPVYKFSASKMTNTATLRSSVLEDLCGGGVRPGSLWAIQMSSIRSGVYGCGTSRWTNGSGPDFKFSSFRPSFKDGKGKRLRHHGFTICDKKK
ncbi:hypothetical protein BHYA_0084g00090 [Botrytis hyacinthi]|uniref:Uncharacterized protein n=1 Tax=Botrytis hyacinthi TaxID=278943 RepID=A0A4Z1GR29_9HELO|nr:hypothetical protein BHYA_0084g00090 [Botrytis hyacinthi]